MKKLELTEQELDTIISSLICHKVELEYSEFDTEYDEEIIKTIKELLNKISYIR